MLLCSSNSEEGNFLLHYDLRHICLSLPMVCFGRYAYNENVDTFSLSLSQLFINFPCMC